MINRSSKKKIQNNELLNIKIKIMVINRLNVHKFICKKLKRIYKIMYEDNNKKNSDIK